MTKYDHKSYPVKPNPIALGLSGNKEQSQPIWSRHLALLGVLPSEGRELSSNLKVQE